MIKRSISRLSLVMALSAAVCGGFMAMPAVAAPSAHTSSSAVIDSIVAVVNEQPITLVQLQERLKTMRVTQSPNATVMDALNGLINQALVDQRALLTGVQVSDAQLNGALSQIAANNHLTLDQLPQAVQSQGLNWGDFVRQVRQDLRLQLLRQNVVHQSVTVTQQDVDAFLVQNPYGLLPGQGSGKPISREVSSPVFVPTAVELQEIVVPLGFSSSPEQIQEAQQKIQAAYQYLAQGASFTEVAKHFSSAPSAFGGGDLGMQPLSKIPPEYLQAIQNLPDNGISQIFRTVNGYVILHVVKRQGHYEEKTHVVEVPTNPTPMERQAYSGKPIMMKEYKMAQIVVPITPVTTAQEAAQIAQGIYQKLLKGAKFADVAKAQSKGVNAPLGGEVGWINEQNTPPQLLSMLAVLKNGAFTEPVKMPAGYFIFLREDARSTNITHEVYEALARQNIYAQRAQDVLSDWVNQLRAGAYIKVFDNALPQDK